MAISNDSITTSFHHSLELEYQELFYQLELLEHKHLINEARHFWIGVELRNKLGSAELLSVHNLPLSSGYSIQKESNIYSIYHLEETIYKFSLCHHNVYTPLIADQFLLITSDCLRC